MTDEQRRNLDVALLLVVPMGSTIPVGWDAESALNALTDMLRERLAEWAEAEGGDV